MSSASGKTKDSLTSPNMVETVQNKQPESVYVTHIV